MFRLDKTYTGWSWERVSRHVLYWLLWLLFYAVVNSNYQQEGFWIWIQLELVVMTAKLPFVYFVIYFLVPRFLIKEQYLAFSIIGILGALMGGLVIAWLYSNVINPFIFDGPSYNIFTTKTLYKVLDLIYVASLPTIIKLLQRQMQQEKQTRQIAEEKLGAELQLLKNQLHPHFLFNTLNNLYGMVLTQDEKSPEVVLRLSDMMSYMLYECDRPYIALEKEIAHLQNYIELEKLRHGKRLDLTFETSGNIEDKQIASLLLMPFVENAFKHGVENNENPSWIRINIWVQDQELEFMVENSLSESAEASIEDLRTQSGIGLANVRKRLDLIYPNQHDLNIRNGSSYLVKLKLQLDQITTL